MLAMLAKEAGKYRERGALGKLLINEDKERL
jgi:hypothetical protein